MANIIPIETVENKILFIRKQKVMIDRDLARLYGVETRVLVQAVKRNINRFPEDFMFQLSIEEMENWKSQIVISNKEKMGLRKLPYVFTEQGIAMLSGVLKSARAVKVNIAIMRTFVSMRKFISTYEGLAVKIAEIESKYDKKIGEIFRVLDFLTKAGEENDKKEIGFKCK